jgi:2'-5' RNA ligase
LADVEVFPSTQVIYLGLKSGNAELTRLHRTLNAGRCQFQEPFPFHPHVTLARDLPDEKVPAAAELAVRRWREFKQPRDFMVDQLVFVKNTYNNCWVDVAGCELDHSKIAI